MYLRTALVAGLVATTSAFLIPSSMNGDVVKDTRFKDISKHFQDLSHTVLSDLNTVVDLDCPDCPIPITKAVEADETETDKTWQDAAKAIHLELETRDNAFWIGGQPVFPIEQARKHMDHGVEASQLNQKTGDLSAKAPIAFAVEVLPPPYPTDPEGFSVVLLEVTVLAYNGVPVKVETVSVRLIKTPDGSYLIHKVDKIPFANTPGARECEGTKPWAACRIKAIIAARLRAIAQAARHGASRVKGWTGGRTKGCGKGKAHGTDSRPPHHHKGPYQHNGTKHHGHYGQHRHHRHHILHRIGRVMRQFFKFFVIPAFLGVLGGLAASAVGVFVGQLIVCLWLRMYRRGQQGLSSIVEVEQVVIEDEKDKLLDEENLPAYKDIETDSVPALNEKN